MIQETRITLRHAGKYNPGNFQEYISIGGYKNVEIALQLKPVEIIDTLIESKLRGRGGAGFPTGLKERFTSESVCDRCIQKYIVCNADEGEPGTFKDRIIMEQDPHVLIEGMIIAAYAIGATKGFIYIRGEYSDSITAVKTAIKQAYSENYLGKNILNSGFDLEIEIKLGAGSYLCGEELTLLESLEGKRGYPRIKPPFPAEKGLFGMPTLINNVETFAHIPYIIEKGPEHYKSMGTPNTPGTKIFTLSGDVNNPGYFETTLGITLRQLIYELGGGIKSNKKLKAILVGGAAGTFVDESLLDVPMGFDTLKERGAVLGSGAVMVMSEDRSLFEMLYSILEFFKHESCGKCVPCRIGTSQLMVLMEETQNGNFNHQELLQKLLSESEYMAKTSLCPLGQSPILPIRSMHSFFKDQF